MITLREAWEIHYIDISNPTLKFSLALSCLRCSYKALQEEEKKIEPSLITLQWFIELKMEMVHEYKLIYNKEFQSMRAHTWEAKLTKTNRLYSLSSI